MGRTCEYISTFVLLIVFHSLFVFHILLSSIGLLAEGRAVKDNVCGKLSPEEHDRMLRDLNSVHWTYFMLTNVKRQTERRLPSVKSDLSKTTFLYGMYGRKCPASDSHNMEDCPVYYVLDNDKNRVPENIVRAKCSCKKCRHQRGFFSSTSCEPVYTYTPVWRRNETDCEFRQILEYVPVACTCKLKKFRIQDV